MLLKLARFSLSQSLSYLAHQVAPELYLSQPESWPLEKLARDQELALFIHKGTPKIRPRDRLFWILFRREFPHHWKANLDVVEPDTVVRWHKLGYRLFWRWKSRAPNTPKVGRKPIDTEIRILIRRLATENPTWGAPRIHAELLKLGFVIDERTVSRYLSRIRPDERKRHPSLLLRIIGNALIESMAHFLKESCPGHRRHGLHGRTHRYLWAALCARRHSPRTA